MNTVKWRVRFAISCGLALTLVGCAHNLVERVPEGNTPSFWWSNAYLLASFGGDAGDQTGEDVKGLSYSPPMAYVSFSEYDPTNKESHPSCWSLSWSHDHIPVPLTSNTPRKYILYKLPPGYYGFSEGHYSYLERGKVTYIGDYVFQGVKKDCIHNCSKITRIKNQEAAKSALTKYGIPEDALVKAEEKHGENIVKGLICMP